MRFKIENNKIDEKSKKKIEESLFLDVGDLLTAAGSCIGAEEMLSEEAVYLFGSPWTQKRKKEIFDLGLDNGMSAPCISASASPAAVFKESTDKEEYKKKFGDYIKKLKQKVDDFLQPGDDSMRDVIYSVLINPAEYALKGWTAAKADMRINTRLLLANFKTSLNISLSDATREHVRILDEKYPITTAMVEADRSMRCHYEYFDELDNGTLTAEKDLQLRKEILAHGQKMLDAYEKMDKIEPYTPEADEIDKHISNHVHTLQRYGLRGLSSMRADTEARVIGIRNGWAIEDLNALSFFLIEKDKKYGTAYYDIGSGKPRKDPVFADGERDFLNRMDSVWKKVETTAVRTEEERRALLGEMRELVKEGYDKGFLQKQSSGLEFGLFTFDRVLERKLPQEEKDLMGSDALEQMISGFDEERQAAANAQPQAPEVPAQAPVEAAEENTGLYYAEGDKKEKWFYKELKEENDAANRATGELTRPTTTYSDMLRYFMGQKGLSFKEAVELENGSDEERKELAREFFMAYAAHPVKDVQLPQSVVENSADWYGRIDAKAIGSILKNPLPDFDPRNPAQLKALKEQHGELGLMAHFVMDYTQDITGLTSRSDLELRGDTAYLDAFGGRKEYARIQGQLMIINQLQDLAYTATSDKYPVYIRALALSYLENIHKNLKGRKLEEADPGLWQYMRSISSVLKDIEDSEEDMLPSEGAPSYAKMADYLEGKGESPFSEEYLSKNIEHKVAEHMSDMIDNDIRYMYRSHQSGSVDLSRIFNLDFMSLREDQLKDLSSDDISNLTDQQKKDIHSCFQKVMGQLIGNFSAQSDLAVIKNEDPMDRYRINGIKISQIASAKFPGLQGKDRETAMEALLMEAMADPHAEVSFIALNFDKNLNIVEQPPRIMPKVKPHMEAESTVAAPDERANRDRMIRGAEQLDAFMPGVFRSFRPENTDLNRTETDANALATGLDKQGRAPEAAFVRYQIARNRVLQGLGSRGGSFGFNTLGALTDKLDLAAGSKRTVSEVFAGLRDFPLIDAARTANEIQEIQNTMASQSPEELKASEENNRRLLIEKMNTLENQIRTMRSNIGKGNTRGQVEAVFSEPKEVERFINGHPGSKDILTELDAKKRALANGWPVRDIDLIASFYVKREILKAAAESKVTGTADRLRYERAYRAVNEICDHIDKQPINNEQQRKEVLAFINSYGNALYNNTVACCGMADRGELAVLKAQMREAINAVPDPELYYTAEKQDILKALLPPAQPAENVIFEAYVQPFDQMVPEEHKKPVSDEKYIQAENAKLAGISSQLEKVPQAAADKDMPDAKRRNAMAEYRNIQTDRIADIQLQANGRLYVNQNCVILNDMLDKLDMGKGAGTVFGTLVDDAGEGNDFALPEAARAAWELNLRMRTALSAVSDGRAVPNDFNLREDILDSINALEQRIREMRQNAGALNREEELSKIFSSESAVSDFVNGAPGSKMILADLEGRKMAIAMGWPLEDIDLISSFYVKRQLLKDAMEAKQEGSKEYRDLEAACKTIDEICRHIDYRPVMNAGDRLDALYYIHDHGSALYNETAANAGMADEGQLYILKAQMKKAMSHVPHATAYKNGNQLKTLLEKAGEMNSDIPDIILNKGEYSAEQLKNKEDFEAQLREQELGEALLDLFDQDEVFYKTGDTPSAEDIAGKSAAVWEAKLLRSFVPGYFDSSEVLERVKRINASVTPGMLKVDAPTRLMDDLRTYYLGKGSCSYTLTEPELDAFGQPLKDENGVVRTVKKEYSLNFESFDDVLELNRLPMEARRQLAEQYLNDLEQHPFGEAADDATAEASARYYAGIHKNALMRLEASAYEGIDFNGLADISRLAKGGSKLFVKAIYAQDFMQNTEMFSIYSPDYENIAPNRLRSAYLDEFGDQEGYAAAIERQEVLQGMKMLATVITSDKMYGLKHRALAKHYLQEIDNVLKVPGKLQPGTVVDAIAKAGFLLDPNVSLPDEAQPDNASLQAYLEGNTASPFAKPYLDKVGSAMKASRANEARMEVMEHLSATGNKGIDTSPIFGLSYIHMPHQHKNERGQLVATPQELPSLLELSDAQKKETRDTFDRVLGHLTGKSRYGKQYDYCLRKGEKITDRFRINGMKPLEYLASINYPNIDQQVQGKELDTIIKATIMTAMADPYKKLSFVPYVMDKNGVQLEDKPVPLSASLKQNERPVYGDATMAALPDDEGGKYYAALFKLTCQFPAIVSFDPSVNYKELVADETAREAVKNQQNAVAATGLYQNLYYDDDRDEMPFPDLEIQRAWPTMVCKEKPMRYDLLVGTSADGKLNEQGKRNLTAVRSFFKTARDKVMETADRWEKTNPVYADYMRVYADIMRTADEGFTWRDMEFGSNLYMLTFGQMGGLAAPDMQKINEDSPRFSNDMLLACMGYPSGSPAFELPQAVFAGRKTALILSETERMKKEETLTKSADRMLRKMMLSEMDELEKRLRSIDELARKSKIPGSPEEEYCRMLGDAGEHPAYINNDVYEASSYFARGTAQAWPDMEGKRAMLANGWPLEDINFLSTLYVNREEKKNLLNNKNSFGREEIEEKKRDIKLLDEVIAKLEETPITNAADRQRMLEYLDGYGDRFYLAAAWDNSGKLDVDDKREKMKQRMASKPGPGAFLSAQELEEARAEYQRYKARKNTAEPDKPTVGGPRTDIERSFLNAERIAALYTMQGRLAKERLGSDPVHGVTIQLINSYLEQVNDFYSNTAYLDPAHEADRRSAFERLVKDSRKLLEQIGRSADHIDNGSGKKLSDKEQRIFDSFSAMQDQIRHMRNSYVAYNDFEMKRQLDISRAAQEALKKAQDEEAIRAYLADHPIVEENGKLYASRDHMLSLSGRYRRQMREFYKGDIPEVLEVVNVDGVLRVKAIEDERKRLSEERIKAQKKVQKTIERERRNRSDEYAGEDLYAEGVDDMFANERRRIRQEHIAAGDVREKQNNAAVERANMIPEDDMRIKQSVSQIVEAAFSAAEEAERKYEAAKNDLSPEKIRETTELGIAHAEAVSRYNMMIMAVTATRSEQNLLRVIKNKWPEWYEQHIAPSISRLDKPGEMHGVIDTRILENLPVKERHELIKEISDELHYSDKQRLKKQLLSCRTLTELEPEEQVSHMLHDRVEELKKGLDAENLGDNEKQEYLEALEYADKYVTLGDRNVKNAYFKHRSIEETVSTASANKALADAFDEIEDRDLKIAVNDLMTNSDSFVADGVFPAQSDAFEKMMGLKLNLSKENINSFATMMEMMEEMGMGMSDDFPGGTVFSRGYGEVSSSRMALIEAVNSGDRQSIIAAKRAYEKARNDIEKLIAFADDKKNFSKYSIAGNIDSTRQLDVPLEYSKDFYTNSKINSVHLLYSALKWAGISVQQFREDPNAAIERIVKKNLEMCDPEIRFRGKSAGELIGEFCKEGLFERGELQNKVTGVQLNLTRIEEALSVMDNDPERRKINHRTYKILDMFRQTVLSHHTNNNAFNDVQRKSEVQQLLSIVDMADLENHRAQMLTKKPIGANGQPVPKITVTDYVAGLGADYNGYAAITKRGEEIIADAVRTGGEKFHPVSFMLSRQAAISFLLLKRAADRGKEGYELLEDEVSNMAQYYESIRAAHPEYNMPALSEAQKQRFEDAAKKHAERMKNAQSRLTAEQKQAIEARKNENTIAGRQTAQHITELNNALKAREQQFVNAYNQIEAQRKNAAVANDNEQVRNALDAKRTAVSAMRQWLIDQAKAGNVTTDYAKKRIGEILALKDNDSAKLPVYEMTDTGAKDTHAGRLKEAENIRELTKKPYENDDEKLAVLLDLEKNEDPIARENRLAEEAAQRQQQMQQEMIRRQEELVRENNRIGDNLSRLIPEALTQRLTERFNEKKNADHTAEAMIADGTDALEPDAYHTAKTDQNDANERLLRLYNSVSGTYTADRLQSTLSDILGQTEGSALFAKLQNKVPVVVELDRLTEAERSHFFAAVVGGLSAEERERILSADDAYKPIRDYDFSSLPDGSLDARLEFENQVDHPQAGRVQELLNEAGMDWAKMTGGKGSRQELDDFRKALYDANAMITEVKPEARTVATYLLDADTKRSSNRAKLIHQKGNEKEENRFMQDLFETRNGIVVTKEERADDARRTAGTNPVLDPEYVRNVSGILRKMEEMELFASNNGAEEMSKVYSFRKMADAQRAVEQALGADMTAEENRRKLIDAVNGLKRIRKDTDELMEMAKKSFSKTDYMDNVDNVRENAVPWRYARDRVSSSQLNAVWQFGNLLKRNNITIDEFAADPGAVMQKIKSSAIEEATTLKGIAKGQSIGEMAAYAANGYYNGVIRSRNADLVGKYTRALGGLIDAEPGEYDPARKAQNIYLFQQNVRGYTSQFGDSAQTNVLQLKDGFRGKSKESIDALKAVMMVPENEFDPDLILMKVPYNADGTYRKPFNFADYVNGKAKLPLQNGVDGFLAAQEGRMEKILKDAAAARAKMEQEFPLSATGKYPGIVGDAFNINTYYPFPLVQARQQGLMELLISKQMQPQYQETEQFKNLENELLNIAERYDTLRKANPQLEMPPLNDGQKKQLETVKKNYLELKNNREKLMGKLEDKIAKQVKKEEKNFTDQMKEYNEKIHKLEERIERRNAKLVRAQEKMSRAAAAANENLGLEAYEEKQAILQEKNALVKEKELAERQREALRTGRMRSLSEQYQTGKLPKKYVEERLKQIDEGRENDRLPELFGDPAHNAQDSKSRSDFLTGTLMNQRGANINVRENRNDNPENWRQWNHLFNTETVFEVVEKADAVRPVQERKRPIKLGDMMRDEFGDNKGRKSVGNKKIEPELKVDDKQRLSLPSKNRR
ncbi:MAG: hypothetical protein K5686_07940 [Lachnospiraceae bacterium]|nr:hypothetical protein [Lachnospiraceae bacterium]